MIGSFFFQRTTCMHTKANKMTSKLSMQKDFSKGGHKSKLQSCNRDPTKFLQSKTALLQLHKTVPLFLFLLQFRLRFLAVVSNNCSSQSIGFCHGLGLGRSGQCQKRLQQPFITKRKLRLIMLLINDCFLKILNSILTLPQILGKFLVTKADCGLSKTSFGKKRSPAGILTNFPEKMVQSECNQPKIVVKVIGSSVLASHA